MTTNLIQVEHFKMVKPLKVMIKMHLLELSYKTNYPVWKHKILETHFKSFYINFQSIFDLNIFKKK